MNKFRREHKLLTDGRTPMTDRQFTKLILVFVFASTTALCAGVMIAVARFL